MIKKLVAIVLLALLLWGAYIAYALLSSPPKFTARWGNVTEASTEVVIQGEWSKPIILPVSMNNVTMNFMGLTVAWTDRVKLSEKNALVVLGIDNHNLVRALFDYLNNGQNGTAKISFNGRLLKVIPLKFSVKRNVHMDLLGKLNFTAESKPILGGLAYTPALLSTKVRWGGEKGNRGILIADMEFYNPNSFPIPVANLTFDLYANGIKIGTGYLPKSTVIPAKGYATVTAVIELDENVLPKVWTLHVKNGEESTVEVQITLSTTILGNTVQIPLKTEKKVVKTNIMEGINEALSQLTRG
ncbi:LEA type 2 family protein [Thermococcus nautili]|uniref:Conserved secreted protein n=1 Tax=Thermococcus nautili TaxID=195522 RepID=W8NVY3_9EURY|nr:LEA type 2 family protein [Thermococcus nautili]AHL23448.1 Conserved secreted protein [Thermococcus nautili]